MKTIGELQASGCIIFECVSGSRAYGLATPKSDIDIRGVFILPKEDYYSMEYVAQVNNKTNDIVYYELKKFIELAAKNNPNILELFHIPERCIRIEHALFKEIKSSLFLSKLTKNTFSNYAFTQIRKARGLKKKIVNPVEKERKSVLDFCFVRKERSAIPLKHFLKESNWNEAHCGLTKVSHMKNCYNLYYSDELDYDGIARTDANDVCLSAIPKSENPIALLYFNVDGYSSYCKKHREYWSWVALRNEERYKNNLANDKNYDAKNMMHTFRLLHMAKEIGEEEKIRVERPDREFLLAIKNGAFEYEDLVLRAEKLREDLEGAFDNTTLMEEPNRAEINALLVRIRATFYKEIQLRK